MTENKTDALVDKLRKYAAEYNLSPFGREIEGTAELLLEAAETIEILTIEFEEHMRYRAIGTVEDCREVMERQIAKKVNNRTLLRDLNGDPYSVRGDCPNCGNIGLLSNTDYCNACGQKLDWSE